jgi:hypothetical protein
VYCLGEGFDSPLIDGVVFAENMTSNIRIVQSALRASRKNKSEPHKKAKIILPVLNIDDWSDSAKESSDMKKVKEVIYQMGVEDETISQKISVYKIAITRRPPKDEIDESADSSESFGEYDEELTQNLRLRTVKRSMMDITYEKAKKIIVEKQIRSKEQYFEQCVKDNRLSTEPDVTYKSKFTNWIDYLSIPREYYTKEECMKKVTEYLSTGEITVDRTDLAAVCVEVCRKDTMFPSPDLWVDYYDVKEISELIKLPRKKKKSLELLY